MKLVILHSGMDDFTGVLDGALFSPLKKYLKQHKTIRFEIIFFVLVQTLLQCMISCRENMVRSGV